MHWSCTCIMEWHPLFVSREKLPILPTTRCVRRLIDVHLSWDIKRYMSKVLAWRNETLRNDIALLYFFSAIGISRLFSHSIVPDVFLSKSDLTLHFHSTITTTLSIRDFDLFICQEWNLSTRLNWSLTSLWKDHRIKRTTCIWNIFLLSAMCNQSNTWGGRHEWFQVQKDNKWTQTLIRLCLAIDNRIQDCQKGCSFPSNKILLRGLSTNFWTKIKNLSSEYGPVIVLVQVLRHWRCNKAYQQMPLITPRREDFSLDVPLESGAASFSFMQDLLSWFLVGTVYSRRL